MHKYGVLQKRLVKNAEIKDLIDKCGKGNREAVGDLLTKVKPNVVHVRSISLTCVLVI